MIENVLDASARLLRLLSLLQVRRDWTGPELAARLDVSARTVRADVARLRTLGYPVEARPGVAGGYRLVAGAAMPPLLLDDDETVAVAVGLRAAATRRLGVEETSLTALAKLEQVLPARLRRRVEAVRDATSTVPATGAPPALEALATTAFAVRGHERLRFGYTKPGGAEEARHVEPQRLVCWGPYWYLLAWDLDRDDWRVFRVDRMTPRPPTGSRFRARRMTEEEVVALVVRRVSTGTWRYRARVLVHAPAAEVAAKVPVVPVEVEPVDATTCLVELGSEDPERLALRLVQLDVDVEVVEGEELARAFGRLAERFRRAAGDRHPS